jgi:NADH-quinone oxidoreductase subunit G
VQEAWRAVFPPGDAKEDWKILRALSAYLLQEPLPYDTRQQLHDYIFERTPHLAEIDCIKPAKWEPFGEKGKVENRQLVYAQTKQNFYQSNPVARASSIMRQCEASFMSSEQQELEAAE